MRSFILSVFATLAFGLFCSAAPTPGLIDAGGPGITFGDRSESPQSLKTILTGASSKVSPYADKISKGLFIHVLLRPVSDSAPCQRASMPLNAPWRS